MHNKNNKITERVVNNFTVCGISCDCDTTALNSQCLTMH